MRGLLLFALFVSAIAFGYALDGASLSSLWHGAVMQLVHGSLAVKVLFAAGLVTLALVWRWHRRLAHTLDTLDTSFAPLAKYPSVTIVRPVRGKDVGAEDNFRSALDTGYPGEVETLFVFDDADDPGLPVARAVVAEHRALNRPGRADVLVAGSPPPGRTGKLNAMIVGASRARGELVGFGDSDTRPGRNVLRGVVEALLSRPDAGSAFAPVLVDQAAKAAGDGLYAIMQNALYSPLAAYAAGKERTLPFIMGQLMVFRREALDSVGGVAVAQGQFVDDMAIGRALHAKGWRNVMSRHPLHIATGGMTLRQFLPVYRRWMMFSKNGLPLSFTWRQWVSGASFFVALGLMLAAWALGGALTALPAAAALVLVGASQLDLQHRYGGAAIPTRLAWTAWGVFFISPFVLASNMLRKRVDWRGRQYSLDGAAALAAVPAPAGMPAAYAELDDDESIDDLPSSDWQSQDEVPQHQLA